MDLDLKSLSGPSVEILRVLMNTPAFYQYGLSIAQQAKLGTSAFYPPVFKMEKLGLLESEFQPGSWPRRRQYRIRQEYVDEVKAFLADLKP